jgi:hypothetical protein
MERNGSYQPLQSVSSSGSRFTSVIVTRDAYGSRLQERTQYSFKALAVQSGAVCDETPPQELMSNPMSATTTNASVPEPPTVAYVSMVENRTARIVLQYPEDLRGAIVSGYHVRVISKSGTIFREFNLEPQEPFVFVSQLAANTIYTVAALTISNIGESQFGAPLDFYSGAPSAPSKLLSFSATNIQSSSLQLHWEPPTDTGGGTIAGKILASTTCVYWHETDLLLLGIQATKFTSAISPPKKSLPRSTLDGTTLYRRFLT